MAKKRHKNKHLFHNDVYFYCKKKRHYGILVFKANEVKQTKTSKQKQKKRDKIMTTLTHVAKPNDSKCKWFQAELKKTLTASDLEYTKFDYFKKNEDFELEKDTLLIHYEELHHRKARGAIFLIGIVTDEKVIWLDPTIEMKKLIKSEGHQDLMIGSGKVNACIRIAVYLRRQENVLEAFIKLKQTSKN